MNTNNNYKSNALIFANLRKKVGTQEEVSKLLNISQSIIAKYETGKAYPRRAKLKKLSELFGVSEGEILMAIDNSARD